MVEILKSTMVLPAEATPKHMLWLSNLDLIAAQNEYTLTIYLYKPEKSRGISSAEILQDALAKALVRFFPLAGRIALGPNGRHAINCNDKGALFVVARADYGLERFEDFEPSPEASKLYVPRFESGCESDRPLLLIQITFLMDGSMVLGASFHHIVADGWASFHFIQTWASIARGDTLPIEPFVERTLLRARTPPTVPFAHPEYSLEPTPIKEPNTFVSKTLKLSKEQISLLKAEASNGRDHTVSTFCAVSAHVWKCTCMVHNLEPNREVRLLFPAGIRARVSPPLPGNYYGNAYIDVSSAAKASDIVSGSISVAAEKIMSTIGLIDDEYTRSVIDELELAYTEKRSISKVNSVPDSHLWIISWLGMPIYDADFGWGCPHFMTEAQINTSRYVLLINNPGKDAGISVVIALEPEKMERFKTLFYEAVLEKK